MGTDEEYPTSPPKRQKTNSPEHVFHAQAPRAVNSLDKSIEAAPSATEVKHNTNSLLDALMLQVEAESTLTTTGQPLAGLGSDPPDSHEQNAKMNHDQEKGLLAEIDANTTNLPLASDRTVNAVTNAQDKTGVQGSPAQEPAITTAHEAPDGFDGAEIIQETPITAPTFETTAQSATMEDETPAAQLSGEPSGEGVEWEMDSSPYEYSTDSDSSSETSSEDDESDNDGDYAMLDPEETARILMQDDGGSDDEGGRPRERENAAPLKTANERVEEVIPKPDIVVTDAMKIEELGHVEFVVESTVVIKAKTSGEYRVLEAGSLVCLESRSVVGVVADLIGRVEEPRYTIRFTNDDDINAAGLSAPGTHVFYVPEHSTFLFTQPLKAVKGSDASNFHDEEVGDDEIEFSDDEAEAEHKRQLKARRQGRTLDVGRGRGGARFSRGGHRGGRGDRHRRLSNDRNMSAYNNGSMEMNYDDVDPADDGYTPLQRPDNLADMMTKGERDNTQMNHPLPPPPPSSHFAQHDHRGRGRGHGRGGRGAHGSHRGSGHSQPQHGWGHARNSTPNFMPQLNLPSTPSLTPQNVSYPPQTPSPMTPLPNGTFNFAGFQPSLGFPFMPPQMPMPVTSPFGANFPLPPPPPVPQYHVPQAQSQPPQPGMAVPPNFSHGPWANNPALAAALQRQAEEQRKNGA